MRAETRGGLQKKTAGKAASVKRKAENSSGGMSPTPTLMAMKPSPHTKATNSAIKASRGDMDQPGCCAALFFSMNQTAMTAPS